MGDEQDIRQMAETAGLDEYSVRQPGLTLAAYVCIQRPEKTQYVHQMQTLQAKQQTTLTKCGIKIREYGFK